MSDYASYNAAVDDLVKQLDSWGIDAVQYANELDRISDEVHLLMRSARQAAFRDILNAVNEIQL